MFNVIYTREAKMAEQIFWAVLVHLQTFQFAFGGNLRSNFPIFSSASSRSWIHQNSIDGQYHGLSHSFGKMSRWHLAKIMLSQKPFDIVRS
jgi:hypothetical protein